MSKRSSPRKGSLQFWPRKRARKFLPRVNWSVVNSNSLKNLKGFICYKVGMMSAIVYDSTPDSMTKGKKIAVPVTILSCPPLKIFSVRFYQNNKPALDMLSDSLDKELKRKINFPKQSKKPVFESIKPEQYDDVSVICYSVVKKSGIKKTPDLSEIALKGNLAEKIIWIKENLGKEINISDVFESGGLVDVRGLTKGKGFQGPVKRFGVKLRGHKSEKGVRKVGSIGPWHPARVTYQVAMAGQMGMHTRVTYNNKIISIKKHSEGNLKNMKNFGDIKTDYVIIRGSVQGPAKRQLLITPALRPNKKQTKKNLELVELR